MKIGFYNIFGETRNAEHETMLRLKYCFEKQGHEFLVFDKSGFIISDGDFKDKYVENVGLDFIFTYNNLRSATTLPDCFSVFFHWAPLGFVGNYEALTLIKVFNAYDMFACAYERDIFSRVSRITTYNTPFVGSSVPLDFVVPAKKRSDRKLFYVGINYERKHGSMRYGKLFKELDSTNKIEIYGPKKVFGAKNLWAGFNSYKGEIPFDGKSIIKQISNAGVCLAVNSPMHSDANGVSNRTYEAAAAGALIISDENKFVRDFFGDSVFYLERDLSEEEASKKILNILNWANENPDKAYKMSKASQDVFVKHLTLDKMVDDLVSAIAEVKSAMTDVSVQCDVIDVIAYVEKLDDFVEIQEQLLRQYYKNLHIIVVSNTIGYDDIKNISRYAFDFVSGDSDYKGESFVDVVKLLKGGGFMFIDKDSVLHQRHIWKNFDVLRNFDTLFAYSGSYIKKTDGYLTLNTSQLSVDDFWKFSAYSEGIDEYVLDTENFFTETAFSRSCALFSRKILDFMDTAEITNISDNIHFYLACCSVIKAKEQGRFTFACTTGYRGNSLEEVNSRLFKNRRHWRAHGRSAKTYIKEMNEAFFKYSHEISTLNYTRNANVGIQKSKYFQKLLKKAISCNVNSFPRLEYEIFSLRCRLNKLFNKIHNYIKCCKK